MVKFVCVRLLKGGILLFLILLLLIATITIILYKKRNSRTALSFLLLICLIAFFTKPSEKTYFKILEEDYFLSCDETMIICNSTGSNHQYMVDLYRTYNVGVFNFYRLKMWYGDGTHLREIDTIGVFHQFIPFTNR